MLSETTLVQDGQFRRSGNLVLDRLFGAEIHVVAASDDRNAALDDLCQRMAEAGRRPYAIPVGGSNAIGAMGYRRAARELLSQCDAAGLRPAEVITCSGSGGTQAGLAFGFAEMDVQTPLLGISCWKAREELSASVASIVGDLQRLVDARQLTMPEIAVDDSQIGVGYGVPTDAAIDAIKLCARLEGILLDPVYTGKAMAGLIRRIGSGFYDGKSPVIFVHTGGAPALFAYDQFVHDGLGEQPRQRTSTPRGE